MQPYRGTVRNVKDRQFGSELDGDHAAGATTLTVVWTNDFNADGGQLYFENASGGVGEIVSYTIPKDPDDDTPSETQIDLATPLANSYVSGDKVWVHPKKVKRIAYFMEPNGTEPLEARVPHQLKPLLKPGGRTDDTAEQIELEERGTEQVVLDVLAQEASVEAPIHATGLDLDEFVVGVPNQEQHQVRWVDAAGVAQAIIYEFASAPGKALSISAGDASQVQLTLFYLAGASFAHLDVEGATVNILDDNGASDFEFDTSAGWQPWTPTLTGWSANPTNTVYRYKQIGKMVVAVIRQGVNGTSNSTSTSISLPVAAATITNMQWDSPATAVDNGAALTTPARASIVSRASVATFTSNYSGAGWTASGGKRIANTTLIYEVA